MPDTGDHKAPLDLHSKPAVLEAQRAADAAGCAGEDYRRQVDAQRRAGAEPPAQRGDRLVLRAWTEEEDKEFVALLAAAAAAAAAAGGERGRALAVAGLTSTYEVEVEVRRHAREAAADTAGTSSAGNQPR